MKAVEAWFADYPATIAAISAIATMFASVIALISARHATMLARPMVEVLADTARLHEAEHGYKLVRAHDGGGTHVVLFFKNRSAFPVSVDQNCFWVRFALSNQAINIAPGEPFLSQPEKELRPFSDVPIIWSDTPGFLNALNEGIGHIPRWRRFGWHFVVALKGGSRVKLRIARALRKQIRPAK